jgi:hypothetical protein
VSSQSLFVLQDCATTRPGMKQSTATRAAVSIPARRWIAFCFGIWERERRVMWLWPNISWHPHIPAFRNVCVSCKLPLFHSTTILVPWLPSRRESSSRQWQLIRQGTDQTSRCQSHCNRNSGQQPESLSKVRKAHQSRVKSGCSREEGL